MAAVTRAIGAIAESGAAETKKNLMRQAEAETARRQARPRPTGVMAREVTPVNLTAAAPKKKELNPALLLDIMHRAATHWARWREPWEADIATLWAASTWMPDIAG